MKKSIIGIIFLACLAVMFLAPPVKSEMKAQLLASNIEALAQMGWITSADYSEAPCCDGNPLESRNVILCSTCTWGKVDGIPTALCRVF